MANRSSNIKNLVISLFAKFFQKLSKNFPKSFQKVFGKFSESFWKVFGKFSESFRKVFGKFSGFPSFFAHFLWKSFRKVFGKFSESFWKVFWKVFRKVFGQFLETVVRHMFFSHCHRIACTSLSRSLVQLERSVAHSDIGFLQLLVKWFDDGMGWG